MSVILSSFKTIQLSRGFASNAILNQSRQTLYHRHQLRSNLSLLQRHMSKDAKEQRVKNEINSKIAEIDEMIKAGRPLRLTHIQKIMKHINSAEHVDGVQLLLLLRCCGNFVQDRPPNEKTNMAQHLWNYMDMYNIPVTITHYNALLKVYLDNESDFCPKSIMSEIKDKQLIPTQITYERIIDYYCQKGNMTETEEILKTMNSEGFPMSENVYNSLIKGYSEAGDMKRAKEILSDMEKDNVMPSSDTYTALMCAYAKKNDVQQVVEIMYNCERKQLVLSHANILSIIYGLALHNNKEYIEMMFFSLKKSSYPIEELSFIIKLTRVGRVELAQKILLRLVPAVRNKVWLRSYINLYVETLVQINTAFDDVYAIFEQLQVSNLGENVMLQALQYTLMYRNEDLATKLLDRFVATGMVIKPHYFWPLLVAKARRHDLSGIFNTLTRMKFSYNTVPDINTIKDYVLPCLSGSTSHLRSILSQSYVPEMIVDNGIVHMLLRNNKMTDAREYMRQHKSIYWATELSTALLRNLYRSHDVESYVSICQNLYRKKINDTRNHNTITDISSVSLVSMDEHLLNLLEYSSRNRTVVVNVLKYLNKVGISLSGKTVDEIRKSLGEYVTHEIKSDLKQLATVKERFQGTVVNSEVLYETILSGWERNSSEDELEFQLISYIRRQKNEGNINPKFYLFAINYYLQRKNEKLAQTYAENLLNYYKDVHQFKHAILKHAGLLLYYRKFNNAYRLLCVPPINSKSVLMQRYSILLLRAMTRRFDADEFNKLYALLLSHKYMTATIESFSALVESYILRGDLVEAVEHFRSNPNEIPVVKATQTKLMKELILKGNDTLLNDVVTYSNQVQGPDETFVHLLFNYIECNKLTEAKKLLESPLILNTLHTIEDRIHKYKLKNDRQNLLRTFTVSTAMPDAIRFFVCMSTLRSFVRTNDWEGGLHLWKTMQANDKQVPSYFLAMLGELLKNNGQKVPFTSNQSVEGTECKNVNSDDEKGVDEAVAPSALQ